MVVLRLAARAPDVDAFVAQYCRYLRGDEIFLVTKAPALPGTRVRFSLELANGEPLIQGKGTVTRVHGGHPNLVPGMDVAFVPLDERSRALVERMQRARPEARPAPATAMLVPKPPPPPPPPPSPSPSPAARSRPAAPASAVASASDPARVSAPPNDAAPANAAASALPPASAAANVDVRIDEPDEPAAPVEPSVASSPVAAEPDSELPANPFCKVSDGAIEYFVEWSIDQSTSESPEAYARFSNVPMARAPFAATRQWRSVPTPFLPVALLLGALIGWIAKPSAPARVRPALAAAGAASAAALPATSPRVPVQPPPPPATVARLAPPAAAAIETRAAMTGPKDAPAASATGSATLVIATQPAGASVSIDGRSRGVTPIAIEVAAGSHEVSLTRARYAPVDVHATAPGNLDITLKRPGGTLVVESTPSGGDVIIKDKHVGTTPVRLDLDAFKSYDVQVTFADGKVWRRKVYVKAPLTEIQARSSDAALTRR